MHGASSFFIIFTYTMLLMLFLSVNLLAFVVVCIVVVIYVSVVVVVNIASVVGTEEYNRGQAVLELWLCAHYQSHCACLPISHSPRHILVINTKTSWLCYTYIYTRNNIIVASKVTSCIPTKQSLTVPQHDYICDIITWTSYRKPGHVYSKKSNMQIW